MKAKTVCERFKERIGRPGKALASLLNSAGGMLLKKADIDPLQLLEFLESDTIVCIDDVERLSPSFRIQDLLSISNFLTEHKGFDVVLICNEEKISDQDQTAYRIYKEKTVNRNIHLVADISGVFERMVGEEMVRTGIRESREVILEMFAHAAEQNLRVLGRVFASIELLGSFGISLLSPEQLRLLCTFTILSGRGDIQPPEFYEFDSLGIRLAMHIAKGQPNEQTQQRLAFVERFFGKNDYTFDRGIYRLVCEGEVDVVHFQQLAAPKPQLSPAEQLYESVKIGKWRYWSDSQVKSLIDEIAELLASDPPLQWRQILRLLAYGRLLAEKSNTVFPSALGPKVAEMLGKRIVEEKPDALLDRRWEIEMDELGKYVKEEAGAVTADALRARREELRCRLTLSIEERNLSSVQSLLSKDVIACSEILFEVGGLDNLFRIRKTATEFFSDVVRALLHELNTWASTEPVLGERSRTLIERVKGIVEDPNEDHMEKWRLGILLKGW